MKTYNERSMVSKEHASFIAKKLACLCSKVPENIRKDLDEGKQDKYALANLLALACGGSTYKLTKDNILLIKNEYFSIEESAVDTMFKNSASRKNERWY